jgi:hypothetical protein
MQNGDGRWKMDFQRGRQFMANKESFPEILAQMAEALFAASSLSPFVPLPV